MIIREETAADYDAVYELVGEAFAHAEHSDGAEQDLVARLRRSSAFIPQLSLVAQEGRTIVGHILFTQARIGSSKVLALAPLAVLPSYQRRGVGRALISHGHDIARNLGFGYSVVLGDPRYYALSGYVKAQDYGIFPPFDLLPEYYMCIRLRDDADPVGGTVEYAEEFF